MHVQGFHHLAIQVQDLEGTGRFYREVLGLTELARHHRPDGTLRSLWLAVGDPGVAGGGFIALEACAGAPPTEGFRRDGAGLLLVALRIAREDRPRILAELQRRGVEVVHQTRWTFYFRDPEGNRLALSHHPADPT